jgi:hypothetical protein
MGRVGGTREVEGAPARFVGMREETGASSARKNVKQSKPMKSCIRSSKAES